jgi:anti-anti-sigma factor
MDGQQMPVPSAASPALAEDPVFVVAVERRAGGAVVAPRGELDCDTAPEFESAFAEALRPEGTEADPPACVVVDCTRLAFCDSSGLNSLLRVRRQALERDVEVRLAAVPGVVTRLLDLTGITGVMPCHSSVAEALGR